ncbi:hypothetical protein L6R52_07365 [Myxococcota bacterium]|nr:hypothetical protein [Myxococcota bacterium]
MNRLSFRLDTPGAGVRRFVFFVATPIALVLATALGAWAIDTTWIGSGRQLSAASLLANFTEIEGRLGALETAAPSTVLASSGTASSGSLGGRVVYPHISAFLTQGTWFVDASATIYATANDDAARICLSDAAGNVFAGSCGPANVMLLSQIRPFTTSHILTVGPAGQRIYILGDQNGTSTINFGTFGVNGDISGDAMKIAAFRIR